MADFNVVILGGGTGGYPAAIRATQLGLSVAIVERDKIGGTCLHRGCIPTKAFLESGEILHIAHKSAEYGVHLENPTLNYPEVFARKNKVVDQLWKGVEGLMKANKITVIKGDGKISGRGKIIVTGEGGEREVTGDNIIVATGSQPRSLPGLDFDGKKVISSDHIILDLQAAPKSVIILGAGAVGVEFASMYNDYGTEVTIVEFQPSLVPLEDREVGQVLQRSFTRRGIKVMTGVGAKPETLKVTDEGVSIDVGNAEKTETLTAEALLVAVGRGGIVDGIGLETVPGVQVERGLIKVDGMLRTGEPNVYAIGDVVGGYQLAHKAWTEGIVVVEHIAGQNPKAIDQMRIPRGTFCRPQIGSIGLSEQQAKDQGYTVKTGKFPFAANGRAMILGEAEGFAKIISDSTSGEILGMFIIGPSATDLIAEGVLARYLEGTPLEIATAIHAHPTLAEVLGEAALALEGRPLHIAH